MADEVLPNLLVCIKYTVKNKPKHNVGSVYMTDFVIYCCRCFQVLITETNTLEKGVLLCLFNNILYGLEGYYVQCSCK